MNIRARFEEIWPVPEGVYWHETACDYMKLDGIDDWQDHYFQRVRDSYAARLDTFTHCQETTDVYVSLVQELINELDEIAGWVEAGRADGDDVIRAIRLTDRAKQIMEQKK
jgi:hypothetical protein